MGLTIDLPSAGLLGISGATGNEIATNTNAVQNGIYVNPSSLSCTLTLPASMDVGGTVLVKTTGTGSIIVASSTNIDGSSSNVTISQNQFARFVYLSDSFGYVKT